MNLRERTPPGHRVCSVWDWDRLQYAYFFVPGKSSVGGWQPLTGLGVERRTNTSTSRVGRDIEDALPLLPATAKRVVLGGQPAWGVQAVGQVCVRGLGGSSVSGLSGWSGYGRRGLGSPDVVGSDSVFGQRLRKLNVISAFMFGLGMGWVLPRSFWILGAGTALALAGMGYSAGGVDALRKRAEALL